MTWKKAEAILAKMANNPDGDYTQEDYEKLYLGFGFTKRNGANHVLYTYKKYKIRATVARHNLHDRYPEDAVKNIAKLKAALNEESLKQQQGGVSNVVQNQDAKPKHDRNSRNQRNKQK